MIEAQLPTHNEWKLYFSIVQTSHNQTFLATNLAWYVIFLKELSLAP